MFFGSWVQIRIWTRLSKNTLGTLILTATPLVLSSCFADSSSVGTIDGEVGSVSVNIAESKISHGTSSTDFPFVITFSGTNSFALTANYLETVSDTVSCDTPTIDASNANAIVVTLSNCTGSGSMQLRVREGALVSGDSGRSAQVTTVESVYVTNGPACPAGYIPVPGNVLYDTDYFCVMKYEAKLLYDSDGDSDFSNASVVDNGNLDSSLNYNNDYSLSTELVKYKAVSVEDGKPWVRIRNRANGAREACRYLNTIEGTSNKFDLITTDEWQTIARNIELLQSGTYSNRGTDSHGDLVFNHGHADSDPNEACDSKEEYVNTDCSNSGGETNFEEKRTHFLTNKQVIWDFAGNVAERVQGYGGLFYTSNSYLSLITDDTHTQSYTLTDTNISTARKIKEIFGPLANYSYSDANNYGGLGFATINFTGGTIVRGGHWTTGVKSGVFNAETSDSGNILNVDVGFRCVYHP